MWAFAAAMASGHGPLLAAVAQRATRLAPELGPQDCRSVVVFPFWLKACVSFRDLFGMVVLFCLVCVLHVI